jgi:hypothetical protein
MENEKYDMDNGKWKIKVQNEKQKWTIAKC